MQPTTVHTTRAPPTCTNPTAPLLPSTSPEKTLDEYSSTQRLLEPACPQDELDTYQPTADNLNPPAPTDP